MAHDAQHGPGGGRGGVQRPVAGGEDWRMTEGRQQALLRVVLRAMPEVGEIADGTWGRDEFRGPFHPVLPRGIESELQNILWDRPGKSNYSRRTPGEVESDLKDEIKKVLVSCEGEPEENGKPATIVLSRRVCVGAWIESGEMIRHARELIRRVEKGEEKEQPEAAATQTLWSKLSSLNPLSRSKSRSGAERTRRSGRLNLLMILLKRELGESHPVFWCADQEGPLRLTVPSFNATVQEDVAFWEECISDRHECLGYLVRIASTYRKVTTESGASERCPHDIFRKWRNEIPASAGKLLGSRCETDTEQLPTWRTLANWKFIVGKDIDVLARPLWSNNPAKTPARQLLAHGVIVVPGTDMLVAKMRAGCEETSPEPEANAGRLVLARTIQRVADGLGDLEALRPNSRSPRPAQHVVEALIAWGRLLTAIEWYGTRADRDPEIAIGPPSMLPEQFRLAAMRSRVYVKPVSENQDRRIPWRDVGGVGGKIAPSSLQLRVPKFLFPLGVRAEPARCSPEVFEAIEDRDWRLWAVRIAADNSLSEGISADSRKVLFTLLKQVDCEGWEGHKRKILSSDEDPRVVADSVKTLLSDVRSLEQTRSHDADELTAKMLDDTRRCARALLGRLHDIDEHELGGLDPPRLRTGKVDVIRWRDRSGGAVAGGITWKVEWSAAEEPFGTEVDVQSVGRDTIRLTFSASPQATKDDIRILESPFVTTVPSGSIPEYLDPIARFGRACVVDGAGSADIHAHITAELKRLRDALAGPDRARFDALIHAATAATPEPHAVHWVRLLRDDERFGFECHPPIESPDDGKTFCVSRVLPDQKLEWQDSDGVEVGADVRVEHAIVEEHGIRVVSRGRPAEGSPERLAARLEDICRGDLPRLAEDAKTIRRVIDLVRTFPDARPRWSKNFVDAIAALLGGVVEMAAAPATGDRTDGLSADMDPLTEAFKTVAGISCHYGHPVTPGEWDVRLGTAEVGPDVERLVVAFHRTVPSGRVIVDQFGIQGDPGREYRCRLSAGWPDDFIEGYERLRALVETLTGGEPRVLELRRAIEDLPRHYLGEKARLAIPGLYASVWHVLMEHPAAAGELAPWREAIADLIRKPYDMVMFEPAKLGDYPAAWIVGPDGNPPRGRRITRVLRPGVRTLAKKLIWPAIVETE